MKVLLGHFLCAIVLLLSPLGIGSSLAFAPEDNPPCWLFRPAQLNRIGTIGVAGAISAETGKSHHKAGLRAVKALTDFYDLTVSEDTLKKQLEEGIRTFPIGGRTFQIVDEFKSRGRIFVYAVEGGSPVNLDSLRNDCVRSCDPEKCDPSWICEPMGKDTAGFLGVSGRATTLEAQYGMAMINGVKQAGYLYGASVSSQSRFASSKTSLGVFKYRFMDGTVTEKSDTASNGLRFIMSDACFEDGQLYTRIICPDLKPLSSIAPEVWMKNPNTAGYNGAVGSVERVASGQISDQISVAIRRGIIALAQSRDIQIKDETDIHLSKSGSFFYQDIRTKSSVTLSAKVMGVYFKPVPTGRRVFVWVVETDE